MRDGGDESVGDFDLSGQRLLFVTREMGLSAVRIDGTNERSLARQVAPQAILHSYDFIVVP